VEDAIGGLREDYFVDMLRQAGIALRYLKSTRGAKTPDYLVVGGPDKLVVEIGGPGKGRQQFKGIEIDRKRVFAHTDSPTAGAIPLFLVGYLV
jgi:hypothetical protein